jgi:hypothetical protein
MNPQDPQNSDVAVVSPDATPAAAPAAPVAAAPAAAAPVKEAVASGAVGFAGVFFDKLKEQSFTIMLMCGMLYYQHTLWMAEKDALTKEVDQKEERILQLVEREHTHTLEREKLLQQQRDQFIESIKEQAAACRLNRQ